ncbi:hypothetical protein Taro_036939 [Colocasia esculenta]|uniref:Uncharacterized protein n=1 Tax=Colocasia esculenta TaxID=4460 RepID=A0A843WJ90_COLES|nr:hypothetical protein [Colocasia esculenta]
MRRLFLPAGEEGKEEEHYQRPKMSTAAGVLLRSRAPNRTLSVALRTHRGASSGAEASSPLSSLRSQISTPGRRIRRSPRLPVEASCLVTMMPLHSAIASARLRSILSAESQSWGLVPQGNSMPL